MRVCLPYPNYKRFDEKKSRIFSLLNFERIFLYSLSMADNTQTPNTADATVLMDLESLIKGHISGIDKRKEELKKIKEMVTGILTNDPTYQEHERLAKEATKVKSKTKSELMKAPNASELVNKIKTMMEEVKEMDGALSDYLREFQRLSGSNEIEGDDGQVREIIYLAKLVKKSKK